MANTMRIWLLVWVISDTMIFKMNAIQNSKEVNNKNTVNTSFAHDDDDKNPQTENHSIVLNLPKPDDRSTNNSKLNDEQENKSGEQTEQPFMQLVIDSLDKIHTDRQGSNTTTIPSNTTSDSIENPIKIEKKSSTESNVTTPAPPLIPIASVKPSIKHNKDTQQKIIIRYALKVYHVQKADLINAQSHVVDIEIFAIRLGKISSF